MKFPMVRELISKELTDSLLHKRDYLMIDTCLEQFYRGYRKKKRAVMPCTFSVMKDGITNMKFSLITFAISKKM